MTQRAMSAGSSASVRDALTGVVDDKNPKQNRLLWTSAELLQNPRVLKSEGLYGSMTQTSVSVGSSVSVRDAPSGVVHA